MIRTSGQFSEPKDLNVLQIVVINFLVTIGVLICALAMGVSLMAAIAVAWLMGAVATICLAAAISFMRQHNNVHPRRIAGGPALVPANVCDPLQLWEADRLMEIDHAKAAIGLDSSGNASLDLREDDEIAAREKPINLKDHSRKRRAV